MIGINTGEEYLARYCKAFEIGFITDTDLQMTVRNAARVCPSCKQKPRLFGAVWDENTLQTNGASRKKRWITAGVVACNCGRSSYFYDVRHRVQEGGDNRAILEKPQLVVSALAQAWNV